MDTLLPNLYTPGAESERAGLRCAVLSRHPLSEPMRLSLAAYSVYQVNPPGRCGDVPDAWMCCTNAVRGFPDVVIAILPKPWLPLFVRTAWHWSGPHTAVIRPVMYEADEWSGTWIGLLWSVRRGELVKRPWLPVKMGVEL